MVSVFKKYVLGTFIEKYRPGYKAESQGVQTLTDSAFKALGYNRKYSVGFRETELTSVKDILTDSYHGNEKRPEYFDWLDFSDSGVIKSSVNDAKKAAAQLKSRGVDKALVMGMGGSSMCAKLLNTAFDSKDGAVEIMTMDNMDPNTLRKQLKKTDDKSAFVIISKSGGTFEAAHVIQGIIGHLRNNKHKGNLEDALKDFASRAVFITEPSEYDYNTSEGKKQGSNSGTLNKLAKELDEKTGIKPMMIEHPPRVGGRFSLFSPVGMFISELKGLNTDEFIAGAHDCLKEFFDSTKLEDSSAVQYALLDSTAALKGDFAARYVMPFSDRLSAVPEFGSQLAGESNNKNSVAALNQMWGRGPTAHHSDVEALCRNDTRRLLLEEIIVKNNDEDTIHGNNGLDSLKDYQLKSMHQDSITKLALPFGRHLSERKGNPVITTVLDKLDEKNLGYLMMRNIVSTVIQSGIHKGDTAKNLDRAVKQDEVEAFKVAKKTDAKDLGLDKTELQVNQVA